MTEDTPRRKRDRDLKALAIGAFEKHVIRYRSAPVWERGRPRGGESYLLMQRYDDGDGWTMNMAAEISLGFLAFIYVGGDIDGVTFGHGPQDPRARIAWMGGHNDVSYYVHQKATIGMSGKHAAASTFDQDIAAADVRDRAEQYHGDDPEEWENHAGFREAIDAVLDDMPHSHGALYEALASELSARDESMLDDFEGTGMVPAQRVYYSWAAVRKLHHLLLEEEAA